MNKKLLSRSGKPVLFVYNADSSLFNQVGDFIHKTISPKTYPCNLCSLTYSGASMKKDWKEFINLLPVKVGFLHKDEFLKFYPDRQNITFPIAFVKEENLLTEFISTNEINQLKSLEDLKTLVKEKVANL
ncbi:hypothetical protein HYW46_04395 [Candidatus Daviesbacteria bacterium]|nr:hypothetical protein [Candidatus Daviesbacteria bacterium]